MRHLNRFEQIAQPGALDLIVLFLMVAFRDQDQPMPLRQLPERFFHAGQQLDLVCGDCIRKGDDAGVLLGRNGSV